MNKKVLILISLISFIGLLLFSCGPSTPRPTKDAHVIFKDGTQTVYHYVYKIEWDGEEGNRGGVIKIFGEDDYRIIAIVPQADVKQTYITYSNH